MARHHLLVLSNPTEGQEDEYNAWYDGQHIPDVLKTPGWISAQRFKMTVKVTEGAEYRYLAIYELETDDPAADVEALLARAGTEAMVMSDALDPGYFCALYQATSPLRRAD
jgi:hypothetical protein